MRTKAIFILTMAFLFCLGLPAYAATTEKVSPFLSLLLKASVAGFPDSLSGQPGELKTITLPKAFEVAEEIQLLINGEIGQPIDWNEFSRELTVMIPYLQPESYILKIKAGNKTSSPIKLTVFPLSLPAGVTPEMVVQSIDDRTRSVINEIALYLSESTDNDDYIQALHAISNIMIEDFNNLSPEYKELITNIYYNSGISTLNIDDDGTILKSNSFIRKEVEFYNCSDNVEQPSCTSSIFTIQDYKYKCGYEYQDFVDKLKLIKLYKYTELVSAINKAVVDFGMSFISTNFSCAEMLAEETMKKTMAAISGFNIANEVIKLLLTDTPILVKEISVEILTNNILFKFDRTSFSSKATFYPVDSDSVQDFFLAARKLATDILVEKIDNFKLSCGYGSANLAFSTIDGGIDKIVNGSYINASLRDDIKHSRVVDIPSGFIRVGSSTGIIEQKYCKCNPSIEIGTALQVIRSPSIRGAKILHDTLLFSYSNIFGKSVDYISHIDIANRAPLVEGKIFSIETESQFNQKVTFSLPESDQECDLIKEYEIIGEAHSGTLELNKENGQFNYTLTNRTPSGNENLQYRIFDGAAWSDPASLAINLGNGYDCVFGQCGCSCQGVNDNGSYICSNWTNGDLRHTNYASRGSSGEGKCLTVYTYLVEGNADATDCVRDSNGYCVSKSNTEVTICPSTNGDTWLTDFEVRGLTPGYMWGQCESNHQDCGDDNPYAIMGHSMTVDGGHISGLVQCGFESQQACENYVWSQINSSDKSEIFNSEHRTCTGVSF